jgi:hypothetical protein
MWQPRVSQSYGSPRPVTGIVLLSLASIYPQVHTISSTTNRGCIPNNTNRLVFVFERHSFMWSWNRASRNTVSINFSLRNIEIRRVEMSSKPNYKPQRVSILKHYFLSKLITKHKNLDSKVTWVSWRYRQLWYPRTMVPAWIKWIELRKPVRGAGVPSSIQTEHLLPSGIWRRVLWLESSLTLLTLRPRDDGRRSSGTSVNSYLTTMLYSPSPDGKHLRSREYILISKDVPLWCSLTKLSSQNLYVTWLIFLPSHFRSR